MTMSNKVYDILKWVVLIAIPAAATLYCTLAAVWGWPLADQISKSANAVCLFLGALIGISTAQYNKKQPPDAE